MRHCHPTRAPLSSVAAHLPRNVQAFADLLSGSEQFDAPMEETYKLLGVDPSSVNTLDAYLKEYFSLVLVGGGPGLRLNFVLPGSWSAGLGRGSGLNARLHCLHTCPRVAQVSANLC